MLSYPITVREDAGEVVATSPDFPEVRVACVEWPNAPAEIADALAVAIGACIARRADVPVPSPGDLRAVLPMQTAIKVELYRAARRGGVSKSELARRLNWHGPQVDRLFKLKHASRIAQLEAAFDALGLRLRIGVEGVAEAG